jgi:putative transposase
MPRLPRRSRPAPFFHVLNRTVRRVPIFIRPGDYRAFLVALQQGLERYPVRLLAYSVLSNHWHMVVGPPDTETLSRFVRWVSATHAIRWHRRHRTVGQGPLYKGRYLAIQIEASANLVRVCRYVERNALAAGLVKRAEHWPWCSLAERLRPEPLIGLTTTPFLTSPAWIDHVNAPNTASDLITDERWQRGIWEDRNPTSVPATPRLVEKTSVPSDDLAKPPGRFLRGVEGRQHLVGVDRRDDENQPDADIEGAKHLRLVEVRRALQPGEQRRNRPALPIE